MEVVLILVSDDLLCVVFFPKSLYLTYNVSAMQVWNTLIEVQPNIYIVYSIFLFANHDILFDSIAAIPHRSEVMLAE